ncbi:MAG: alginate export family protein [Gammaproteobacteria bacterium]
MANKNTKQHRWKPLVSGLTATILGAAVSSAAADTFTDQIANALKGDWGQINFNLRWRHENVDQDGPTPPITSVANADTVRLRLGYLTPKFYDFQAFAEFEGNTWLFVEHYNSTLNGRTNFPVVADPQRSEINQGWLTYSGIPDTVAKAGRQRIIYDNHRFIGNVVWRQMEQTYDSVSVVNQTIGNSELTVAYLWNVRNIFSADREISAPLVHLAYNFADIGKLTTYAYLLDFAGNTGAALRDSTQTYGIRFDGKRGVLDNLNANYTAEYAYQRDYKSNPNRYDANYIHVIGGLEVPELGFGFSNFTAQVAWEQLGSQNNRSLQTPLGTNHAFQGWADLFLVTPAQGIQDLYGTVGTKFFGVQFMAVYHQFDSAVGGVDYGSEIDALAVKKISDHYTLLLKYANFFGRDPRFRDTQKIWAEIDVDF